MDYTANMSFGTYRQGEVIDPADFKAAELKALVDGGVITPVDSAPTAKAVEPVS